MMILAEQLLTIIFSIIYGMFFYLLIYLNKKMLFNKNIIKRFIFSLFFIIDMTLIYFILIKNINGGILTYYSYICILIGISVQKKIIKKIKTYKK